MSASQPKGDLRDFLKDAAEYGWEFEGYDGNGHPRLHHPASGERYSASLTPSDWRSRKNSMADLKRIAGASTPKEPGVAIELFTYHDEEDRSARQVRVIIEDSPLGEPVWIGRDVCEVVGISKYRDALVQLDGDEKCFVSMTTDTNVRRQMTAVTEAGVWSLLLISRSPKVKPFKRWLTHKVLPAIRKTGSYTVGDEAEPPTHSEALRRWADELERRQLAEAERDTALEWAVELESPAAAWRQLADSVGDYDVADAANVLSRDPNICIGRDRLFAFMLAEGWIYRGRYNRWRPYQKQVDAGRLVGMVGDTRVPTLRVTLTGIEVLHKLLGGTAPRPALVAAT